MKPMDADFLEFWGNMLLNAARSQRASEALADWMQQGVSAMGEFSGMFQKAYGLAPPGANETPASAETDDNAWQRAMDQFQTGFRQYLQMLDVVPRSEHHALKKRCDDLQKEMMQCQATVTRLESRLARLQDASDQSQFSADFSKLIEKQTQEFHRMMEGYNEALKSENE